jgi:hypothetical protein
VIGNVMSTETSAWGVAMMLTWSTTTSGAISLSARSKKVASITIRKRCFSESKESAVSPSIVILKLKVRIVPSASATSILLSAAIEAIVTLGSGMLAMEHLYSATQLLHRG